MEEINKKIESKSSAGLYQKLVYSVFEKFPKGTMLMTLPNGEVKEFGKTKELICDIQVTDWKFFKRCTFGGDIGFGESYELGYWETSDLTQVIKWFILNVEDSGVLSGAKRKHLHVNWKAPIARVGHWLNSNTLSGSKENIKFHYDLSNAFYEYMLEENMLYSCGIFESKDSTLNDAQYLKLETLCRDLDIKSTDHILEIGCGWGSFAIYAAKNFGCKVSSVTISQAQFEYAQERIKKEGLEDKIQLIFKDYRELDGQYDKIVSIEMIEAVGDKYLPSFFKKCEELLKPDGVFVMQAITSPDARYESFKQGTDWIQTYIFPGSLLPSVGALTKAANQESTFHLYKLRDIGLHYAKTLRLWRENFHQHWETIKELGFDEAFARRWRYYLCYCEAAFAMRNISDVQISFIRPNNREVHYEQV